MGAPADLSTPLSDDEIDRLDLFLLERLGEDVDADNDERDEGILSISELDGFLTAIASGPRIVAPSAWLPALWGDWPPEWSSEDEELEIFALMMRHMNAIAAHLTDEPGTFEPIFLTHETEEGEERIFAEPWCMGYVRAVALDAEVWREGGKGMESLLQPIFMHGSPEGWSGLEELPEERRESLREEITPAVRAIDDFWRERRTSSAKDAQEPVRRSDRRVGRNDPCPCGSGKKYKHCCLH